MAGSMKRRTFLTMGAAGAVGSAGLVPLVPPHVSAIFGDDVFLPASDDDPPATFPLQDPGLVRQVVATSHGNLERVRELVTAYPELAKAAVDWGFGDWESALGAASHTGNREIALLLLENGARPTLFSAAMLGHVDVVRAMVETSPGVQGTLGPHGFTLMAHARLGGEQAAGVVAYLEGVGGADPPAQSAPLADAENRALLGAFRYGSGDDELLEVTDRDGARFIGRPGYTARGMTHLGDLAFHPAGAPSVRIVFEAGDPSPTLRVRAGGVEIAAMREAR